MTELIQRYAAALYDLAQTDNMGLTGAAQELLEQALLPNFLKWMISI